MDDEAGFELSLSALLTDLSDINRILTDAGEAHWAIWMANVQDRLARYDAGGFDVFLSALGGMGSLNDLVLHPANGHRLAIGDVDGVNEKLAALVDSAASRCRALRRELT